jgi:hypothetical protein
VRKKQQEAGKQLSHYKNRDPPMGPLFLQMSGSVLSCYYRGKKKRQVRKVRHCGTGSQPGEEWTGKCAEKIEGDVAQHEVQRLDQYQAPERDERGQFHAAAEVFPEGQRD